MTIIINSSLYFDGSEEKSEKRFEGKYEQNGDFVRISYFDFERNTNCFLVFSKTRNDFFRMNEKGDVNVCCECNSGCGEMKISLGNSSALKFGISDFERSLTTCGAEFKYKIIYSQSEKTDISISLKALI